MARATLTAAALAALLLAAWQYRAPIWHVVTSTNPWLLALSTLLALLSNYLTGMPFQSFLKQSGIEIQARISCYLQLVVQVTKYIPGNIWGALLQAQLIGSTRVGSLFLAGIDTSVFFMMTVGSTGLGLLVYCHSAALGCLVACAGWLFSAAIASSAWLARLVSRTARVFGKELSATPSDSSFREVGRLFMWAAIHSMIMLASIFALLIATTGYGGNDLIVGAASICLAWVAGTIAIVVPSGLGVREVAFVYLASKLGVSADVKSLAAIAIIARVTLTLPDMLAAAIVAIVEARSALSKGLRSRTL
ncbi:lysylphosphatidylglycerol synthase domain-containing protein [Dyella soli]|nr:lysylphosphatidylglycerol synthase domain-containing protein [Dyella soli]